MAAQLGPGQWATSIDVEIDNHLLAQSESRSVTFIAKKDPRIEVATRAVPEPGAWLLLAGGGLAWVGLAWRRR